MSDTKKAAHCAAFFLGRLHPVGDSKRRAALPLAPTEQRPPGEAVAPDGPAAAMSASDRLRTYFMRAFFFGPGRWTNVNLSNGTSPEPCWLPLRLKSRMRPGIESIGS